MSVGAASGCVIIARLHRDANVTVSLAELPNRATTAEAPTSSRFVVGIEKLPIRYRST
ncbi:MAG: hypothetical protein ABW328_09245 [Ilumatobacteraceae bacterium]